MKRELIENIRVIPYTSAGVIDRSGFLSGILAVKVASVTGTPTAASLAVTATECDTSDGTYKAVADTKIFVNGGSTLDVDVTNGLDANIDLDLIGCKRYVKLTIAVTFTGGTTPSSTNSYAVALGDSIEQPV